MDIVECIPAHLPLLHTHMHIFSARGWLAHSVLQSPACNTSRGHQRKVSWVTAVRQTHVLFLFFLREQKQCRSVFAAFADGSYFHLGKECLLWLDILFVVFILGREQGLCNASSACRTLWWKESKCCNYFQRISLQTGLSRSKQYEIFPWLRYNLFVANIFAVVIFCLPSIIF